MSKSPDTLTHDTSFLTPGKRAKHVTAGRQDKGFGEGHNAGMDAANSECNEIINRTRIGSLSSDEIVNSMLFLGKKETPKCCEPFFGFADVVAFVHKQATRLSMILINNPRRSQPKNSSPVHLRYDVWNCAATRSALLSTAPTNDSMPPSPPACDHPMYSLNISQMSGYRAYGLQVRRMMDQLAI